MNNKRILRDIVKNLMFRIGAVTVAIGMWGGGQAMAQDDLAGEDESGARPVSPQPGIYLQINSGDDEAIFQGTPLLLMVKVANPQAVNVALQNGTRGTIQQGIEEQLSDGLLSTNDAEEQIKNLPVPQEVPSIRLPSGWSGQVQILVRRGEGEWAPPPVSATKLAGEDAAGVLDDKTAVRARWSVSPQESSKLEPGTWEWMAVLDATNPPAAGAGAWSGRVESEPAPLVIQARPEHPEKADAVKMALDEGLYWEKLGDNGKAVSAGKQAVEADTNSLDAHGFLSHALLRAGQKEEAALERKKVDSLFMVQEGTNTAAIPAGPVGKVPAK